MLLRPRGYPVYINHQFVVLHTCTQTSFHTRHIREMHDIFRGAHNYKRQYVIEPFLIRSVQTWAFWTTVSVQSTGFIMFNHSCRCFVWQWQQVCDHIYNLRLYYIDSPNKTFTFMHLADAFILHYTKNTCDSLQMTSKRHWFPPTSSQM